MLEVKDNLTRGLQSISPEELKPIKDDQQAIEERHQLFSDAAKMTQEIMLKVLAKHGVREYNPVGETFDSSRHESVATVPHDTLKPGTIAEVVCCGYTIGQRLLRPAKVSVVKNNPKTNGKK